MKVKNTPNNKYVAFPHFSTWQTSATIAYEQKMKMFVNGHVLMWVSFISFHVLGI